jgi:hypothetical protein
MIASRSPGRARRPKPIHLETTADQYASSSGIADAEFHLATWPRPTMSVKARRCRHPAADHPIIQQLGDESDKPPRRRNRRLDPLQRHNRAMPGFIVGQPSSHKRAAESGAIRHHRAGRRASGD